MPDTICDTSPIQYLHQLRQLDILPGLSNRVIIPNAVAKELQEGHKLGVDLPDVENLSWVTVLEPKSATALPLVTDLGRGEAAVLALALEDRSATIVVDDRVARRVAHLLGLRITGTLGLLLDAKRAGLVERIEPLLNELESLRFRLAEQTRAAVLRLAGESDNAHPSSR